MSPRKDGNSKDSKKTQSPKAPKGGSKGGHKSGRGDEKGGKGK